MSPSMQGVFARAVLCAIFVLSSVYAFGYGPAQGAGGGGSALSGLGSTDNAVVRTDGTGGDRVQGSSVTVDDSGNIGTSGGVVIGGATTSGVRLDVSGGNLRVREGDGSAYGPELHANKVAIRSLSDQPRATLEEFSLNLNSAGAVLFAPTTTLTTAPDTGLKRASAGVLQATNGSTGSGAVSASSFLITGSAYAMRNATQLIFDTVGTALIRNQQGVGTLRIRASAIDFADETDATIASVTAAGTLRLPVFTVATLPAATAAGQIVYVSDGAAGSPCLAFSDGTNWLRCDTLAAVSSS